MDHNCIIAFLLLMVCIVQGDHIQELTSASNGFSQRLYQKLAMTQPNVVYSPYSIHLEMTMTSLGAREDTATEMSLALGLTSLTGKSPHQVYHDLIVKMNTTQDVKINTANAIFINPKIPIKSQFVKQLQQDYLSTVDNFDLATPEGPEKKINDFVDNNTQGMIKDTLQPGSIDATTTMVLVNTVFFNGTWERKFDPYKTTMDTFYQLGGASTQVDMMNDDRSVNIRRNVSGVDVAELPFRGRRFSFYIALPQKTDGITALESWLAEPGNVQQLFDGLAPVAVKLSVPRFKIESSYSLTRTLQQLGMVKAFDPVSANFQGISSAGSIYINDVAHKAMIEVKETGTVAAAATVISLRTLAHLQPPTETFKADHSFIFFLRDKQTQQILFQGKCSG